MDNLFKFKVGQGVFCINEKDLSSVIKQIKNGDTNSYLLCNGSSLFYQDESNLIHSVLSFELMQKVTAFLLQEAERISSESCGSVL